MYSFQPLPGYNVHLWPRPRCGILMVDAVLFPACPLVPRPVRKSNITTLFIITISPTPVIGFLLLASPSIKLFKAPCYVCVVFVVVIINTVVHCVFAFVCVVSVNYCRKSY